MFNFDRLVFSNKRHAYFKTINAFIIFLHYAITIYTGIVNVIIEFSCCPTQNEYVYISIYLRYGNVKLTHYQ